MVNSRIWRCEARQAKQKAAWPVQPVETAGQFRLFFQFAASSPPKRKEHRASHAQHPPFCPAIIAEKVAEQMITRRKYFF
jgi:hypothetical protein